MIVEKYKTTKKLYSRKYRKTHKKSISAYERTPKALKAREARNKAHAKKVGKGKSFKEVIHKNGNPLSNNPQNLEVVKPYKGGGKKGNKNALKNK